MIQSYVFPFQACKYIVETNLSRCKSFIFSDICDHLSHRQLNVSNELVHRAPRHDSLPIIGPRVWQTKVPQSSSAARYNLNGLTIFPLAGSFVEPAVTAGYVGGGLWVAVHEQGAYVPWGYPGHLLLAGLLLGDIPKLVGHFPTGQPRNSPVHPAH